MAIKNEQLSSEEERAYGPFRITKIIDPRVQQYQPTGEWTEKENECYAQFIKKNIKVMQGKECNKLWGIFKEMAKSIKTRNFTQCKSHHQRLYNEFQTIPAILAHLSANQNRLKAKNSRIITTKVIISRPQIKQSKISFEKIEQQNEPIFNSFAMNRVVSEPHWFKTMIPTPDDPQQAEQQWHLRNRSTREQNQGVASGVFVMQSETSIMMRPFDVPADRSQQWIQCYNIFRLWYTKLQKLTSSG